MPGNIIGIERTSVREMRAKQRAVSQEQRQQLHSGEGEALPVPSQSLSFTHRKLALTNITVQVRNSLVTVEQAV